MLYRAQGYHQQTIQTQMDKTLNTIHRDGLEKTTENLFYKLRNENIQHLKDTELKGIQAAETKYQNYDTIFNSMRESLDNFRVKLIDKINASHNNESTTAINQDLEGMKEFFKNLTDTKINGEKMFDHYSELLIGDGLRVPRTFDSEYIKVNGQDVTDIMDTLINSDTPDLDTFDTVINTITTRHTEIGARWNGIKSMKGMYENIKLSEDEFMSKRYKLEEAIAEFNNLSISYEALNKMIAKVSSLSLVHYV